VLEKISGVEGAQMYIYVVESRLIIAVDREGRIMVRDIQGNVTNK